MLSKLSIVAGAQLTSAAAICLQNIVLCQSGLSHSCHQLFNLHYHKPQAL